MQSLILFIVIIIGNNYIITLHCLPPAITTALYYSDDLGEKLYWASQFPGLMDEVERLLAEGAPVNWRDRYKQTALHMACYNNLPDVVKILTQQDGINVNVQSTGKDTPLHRACYWGYLKCLRLLMATGNCDLGKSVCVPIITG